MWRMLGITWGTDHTVSFIKCTFSNPTNSAELLVSLNENKKGIRKHLSSAGYLESSETTPGIRKEPMKVLDDSMSLKHKIIKFSKGHKEPRDRMCLPTCLETKDQKFMITIRTKAFEGLVGCGAHINHIPPVHAHGSYDRMSGY